MTVLLNIVPLLICVGLAFFGFKKRSIWLVVLACFMALAYNLIQPSYMPKGTVQRSEVPAFTESNASIEDRNSKPVPSGERDQQREESIKEGLEFKRP